MDSEFTDAAMKGSRGAMPIKRVLVQPDSGDAMYGSDWRNKNATFLFFSAAYGGNHSKQADQNSFVLRSGGIDLIVAAGPYRYSYTDRLIRHGHAQLGHDTQRFDRVSIPRTSGGDKVTGTLAAEHVDESGFTVTRRNPQLVSALHERTLTVVEIDGKPRVDVQDTVENATESCCEILWNLGPDVQAVIHGHGFELYRKGAKLMDAHFVADVPLRVALHRAQKAPNFRGWRFPKIGPVEPTDVVRVCCVGTRAHIRTAIRLTDFTYHDRGLGDLSTPWRRWTGEAGDVGLNYLHVSAKTPVGSAGLVVVFTAVHEPGDFTYNYKAAVDQTGLHALYVLDDFGDQGAYYLQDHGDRGIFASVQALIAAKLDELGLAAGDLITVGSSKGGTAALIHGLAAGAGHIFVGAPQTRIGSFLSKTHPNILQLMTGGTSDLEVAELDDALYTLATASLHDRPDSHSRVTIIVGDADHHYRHHALPVVKHLRALGSSPSLIVLPGLTHADIGTVYRSCLLAFLQGIETRQSNHALGSATPTQESLEVLTVMATARGQSVTAMALGSRAAAFAGRLLRGNESVASCAYSACPSMTWKNLAPGRYRVRVFAKANTDDSVTAQTTGWVEVR